MDTIEYFYRPEDIPRLAQKWEKERLLILAIGGLTLLLCVLLCCLTNTANAPRMELAVILISLVGGWIVIYRRVFGLQEADRERQHAAYLLSEPSQLLRGKLTVTRERLRIVRSIRIRILELDDGTEVHRLKVNENWTGRLRKRNGQTVTLAIAGGYVAGIGDGDAHD